MANKNDLIRLKDNEGVYRCPVTKSNGVFMSDGNTTLAEFSIETNASLEQVKQQQGGLNNLETVEKTNLVGAINETYNKALEAFQSASDGKQKLATAITGKGVETSPTDSFDTMVANINNLSQVTINGEKVNRVLNLVEIGRDWSLETSMNLPYNFYQGSGVALNEEIHILGGSKTGTYTNHYKYNGFEWEEVSTLPYDFYLSGAVVLNGEIHILGSYSSSENYKKHYKFNGSTWEEVSTLPYNFYRGSAVVYNNEIHILGGIDDTTTLVKHCKFNGSTWEEVSTLPYKFCNGCAVVLNDEIHILGGSRVGTFWLHYKWNGEVWEEANELPHTFSFGSAVVLSNEIHVLGGNGGTDTATKHYKSIDFSKDSVWEETSVLPYKYYYGASAVFNNDIYLIGGGANTDSYLSVARFYAKYKVETINK